MYIYLHGFSSGPGSTKAKYIREYCDRSGIDIQFPDLNQGDFARLTISRQILQIVDLFPRDSTPVTLIGSSLGGWIAEIIAQNYPQVERLVLLAPAFDFLTYWLPKIGDIQLKAWEENRYLSIYHHAVQDLLPLHYNFVVDAHQYHFSQSGRIIPTLIIHGIHDEVIPISASRHFAIKCPCVELLEVDSNHALTDTSNSQDGAILKLLLQEICRFCQI